MTKYTLAGIGNAVVDVISHADDSFLDLMGIEKGIMQLIEQDRGEVLYAAMTDRLQTPGGAVANTIAGVGALGLPTAFIGRVHDDALGRFYAQSMQDSGTDFVNAPIPDGELPTSRCMIFVTPDGERSLNTYLGISTELGPEDVPEAVASNAEIMFLEGYLFDKDKGKEAFRQASRFTRAAGGKAGIAISDPFCVDRHREAFKALIAQHTDLLFANEHEVMSLYETDELDEAMTRVAQDVDMAAITVGARGAYVVTQAETIHVPTAATKIVDATGAGDLFAAGFLAGLTQGKDLATCASMGCVAAGEVIGHIGPRPEADLKALMAERGL